MANENIGSIACPFSGGAAFIRKKKNGSNKTPLYIWSVLYGQTFMNTQAGQDYILERGSLYGIQGEPEQAPAPVKPPKIPYKGKPPEKPINTPAPAVEVKRENEAPKKASILDGWL